MKQKKKKSINACKKPNLSQVLLFSLKREEINQEHLPSSFPLQFVEVTCTFQCLLFC